MASVTLIGEQLAKEGAEFTYIGSLNDCKNCKLKSVCFNLKPGRKYTIRNIREKHHACEIHEGDVVVVEVTEQPIRTVLTTQEKPTSTIQGKKITCKHIGCEHYILCSNPAIQPGKTYIVKKNLGKITCPVNLELYQVELSD